tara:strand:+ start:737 stop:1879 length:1143 start_codon:yes stop_codon:yes gene_type:complete
LIKSTQEQILRAIYIALIFFLIVQLEASSLDNRALWIVRDHIITKADIDEVLQFAENNNYNNLFVQVRGRGDAYYSSKLVPRTHLLRKTKFDPLEYILKKAKGKNFKIHAWLNVYYLWSSPEKPIQEDHLLLNHPEWLDTKHPDIMDVPNTLNLMKKNKNINGEGFYLAPTHPEVDAHLQNIITELLQNYHLDGIHFDYIRYHNLGWGMNPTGLKFFLNYSSGMPGIPSIALQNKLKFSEFKKHAITKFLKKASMRIRAYQPHCIISAAVKPNIHQAHNTFSQEWDVWLNNGYIDWAVPMNYTKDNKVFNKNIVSIINGLDPDLIDNVIMGIGIYNQNFDSAGTKIKDTRKNKFGGVSIFSYTVFKNDSKYAKGIIKYLD